MLEDQLLLVIRFEHDRILVEPLDLPHEANSTKQENGDEYFVATHGVEIHILNALCRQLVLHCKSPQKAVVRWDQRGSKSCICRWTSSLICGLSPNPSNQMVPGNFRNHVIW